MRIKLQKLILPFVIKKHNGLLFIFEVLFIFLLLIMFLIGYQTINLSFDYTKIIMYTKAQDLYTIIAAKNITNLDEIKAIIENFLGDIDYQIESNGEIKERITGKTNCISKNVQIWSGYPVTKQTIFVKICY